MTDQEILEAVNGVMAEEVAPALITLASAPLRIHEC